MLQTIPGVGEKVAQVIVAETGADMSRFPTAAHLAAWAGLAPAMHESAGKRTPAGKRRGNKWLAAMLVEAAGSVGRMQSKNYLAAQHARLTKRRGMGRAQVAVAHSILVAAYYMLQRDQPYQDLGADWHQQRNDGSPHPPARRPTGEARPHRGPRPSSLITRRHLQRRESVPTLPHACPRSGDSRVCIGFATLRIAALGDENRGRVPSGDVGFTLVRESP